MKSTVCLVLLCCVASLRALSLDSSKSDILPSIKTCGLQHSDDKEHEFPWVVYIPLQSRVYNPDFDTRCAGTLISKRYVVFSSTCYQFVLTKLHLGQYDTTKNVTCVGNECKPVLEVGIESKEIDLDKEIALVRLDKEVEFTDYIKPICLPFENFKKPEPGATVYTSGWGKTEYTGKNSDTKKKVKQTLISNEDCKKAGVDHVNDKYSICVKLQDDSTHKPCNGDEGSPVMYSSDNKQWVFQGALIWLFDAIDQGCTIKKPARGFRITDDVLQWIVEKIHA